MIRQNNPAIDAAALERRVRDAAARALADGALDGPFPPGADAGTRAAAIARRLELVTTLLDDVERRIALAIERAAPRRALPPRLAKLGLFALPFNVLLRLHGYAFKTQREIDVEQNSSLIGIAFALREIVAAQRSLVEHAVPPEDREPTG